MSGGTTMYALKPIVTTRDAIKRDSCMYEMKNIHGLRSENSSDGDHACIVTNKIVTDINEQVISFLKSPLPEVALLEARQEKILSQIVQLKEQVLNLCNVLKSDNQSQTVTESQRRREAVNINLVVNANPIKPCHSLRALQKIWKDVNISIKAYKHSSTEECIPELSLDNKHNFQDSINLSLIWKKVEDTEVVLSGVRGYPLIGESNLVRYLVRRLSGNNYEDSLTPRELSNLDYVLDQSHRLQYQESAKDIQSILSGISDKLGKNNWLSGAKTPGISDAVAWSAIKNASLPKLPSPLNKWFENCNNLFLK